MEDGEVGRDANVECSEFNSSSAEAEELEDGGENAGDEKRDESNTEHVFQLHLISSG